MEIGLDGWVTLTAPDGAAGLHVRVGRSGDRVVITDVYLHGGELTSAQLRAVHLGKIEALLDLPMSQWTDDEHQLTGAGALRVVSMQEPHRKRVPEPTLAELRERKPAKPTKRRARPPLRRPDGGDPDAFYRQVAEAYLELASTTRGPAPAMAAEAGVPVTTVHRWVREARRRKFLPPGRTGKTG